jgi:hypothetical protein
VPAKFLDACLPYTFATATITAWFIKMNVVLDAGRNASDIVAPWKRAIPFTLHQAAV